MHLRENGVKTLEYDDGQIFREILWVVLAVRQKCSPPIMNEICHLFSATGLPPASLIF